MKKSFEELELKERLILIKKCFEWATKDRASKPLLKFTMEKDWLNVEYLNILNYIPSKNPEKSYGWKILCSQSLNDYVSLKEAINRITLMLASELVSKNQDINGILDEYNLIKK